MKKRKDKTEDEDFVLAIASEPQVRYQGPEIPLTGKASASLTKLLADERQEANDD